MAEYNFGSSDLDDSRYSFIRQLNYQAASLLVEDQDDSWMLLRFALAKQLPDVQLYRTSSRSQTLAFLEEKLARDLPLPKLILQDLYIPNRADGLGLIQDIRAMLANHQHIPLLVVSSSVDQQDIRQAYQCSASYYVVKPASIHGWLTLCQGIRSFWWDQGVLPLTAPLSGQ